MKVNGKLVKFLEVQKGTSKAGKEWMKQEFVINTGDDYNPEICLSVFGAEKVGGLKQFSEGQELEVSINIYSREYKGKYYHSIDAWKIELAGGESQEVEVGESNGMPF